MASYNRHPRKRLGQHFLTDPQVLQRIINAAELDIDDLVIEIGSGLGVVTSEIAKLVYHLVAIEIDKELLKISKDVLKLFHNISFEPKDILKIDLHELALGRKYKIIGNLPYYITAPIIEKILEAKDKAELAVLMVQKEVAERMAEAPGSKKYGSFSVFVQYHAEVKLNSFVSKSSFLPWPEVGSALVVLKPHQTPKYKVKDEKLFFDIVHAAFQQRRKQLSNSLSEFKIEGIDIDLSRRPETLGIDEFVKITNYCYNPSS
ncbi:ribosomal RNA small subunit methyltransferase A [candidate division WOR-1 bacterium RIFCSPLOWO2_02_FULL_46_20]|uniref:Ribosomal RNA small subunit methyltransferase A n=2 Tax=Saganbacteria TaxID=1703751 RepID=A0A1F4RDL5_UNCSA|nr:MAG: ribosomal RNA small subunit methyltransferase A [candidate division WOR-1 bacterium RIFCSPHIGHO2_02_FULL_45_12]OGC05553.1 MAG: ribosomal RNA small subunit methyltransferase A [candidate division WOR-1 bacterium RIFCSPLOWO2_02_FULL_46_20]OGC09096.1 MAG: ribosomal RNA small subunit methyltransferase A [candidate division WOR-1 bacterium RIFCSPLOWO2_12_FULL_45_9]